MIQYFIAKLKSNKSSLFLFSGNSVITLLNFFIISFLSHTLIEEQYATFRQIMTFMNIGIALGALGFSNAVYYFLNAEEEREKKYRVVNASRFLVISGGFFACLFMLLFQYFFKRDFSNPAFDRLIGYGFLLILLNIIQTIDFNTLVALKRYKYYLLSMLSSIVIKITCFIYLYYTHSPLEQYMFVLVLITIYTSLLNFFFIERTFGFRYPVSINREEVLRQLKYGWPIGLGAFLGILTGNTDRMVIPFFIQEERAFAILANGSFEVPLISNFYYSFTLIAIPLMISAYKERDMQKLYNVRAGYIRQVVPILFPVVLALIHWSTPVILLLFGPRYPESGHIFAVYSLILLLRFCSHHEIFMVTGKTTYIIYLQIIEVFFNLLLMIVLVRSWGMIGAPVSCVITNYLYMTATTFLSARITGIPVKRMFPYAFLLKNLAVGLAVLGLVHFLSDITGTYRLGGAWIGEIAVFLLAYALVFTGLRKQGFFE